MSESLTLSAREVAEILGVSDHVIYEAAKLGELPAIRLRRTVRFSRRVIEQTLSEGRIPRMPEDGGEAEVRALLEHANGLAHLSPARPRVVGRGR